MCANHSTSSNCWKPILQPTYHLFPSYRLRTQCNSILQNNLNRVFTINLSSQFLCDLQSTPVWYIGVSEWHSSPCDLGAHLSCGFICYRGGTMATNGLRHYAMENMLKMHGSHCLQRFLQVSLLILLYRWLESVGL